MPEVVSHFVENRDFRSARLLQRKILTSYQNDFSKHAPKEIVPRINMVWKSIPSQLSKENKKFIYGVIKEGARAKENDVGLLGAMAKLPLKTILDGNTIFTEFKGALTENFVIQQLLLNEDNDIYYWTNENSTAEVDFVIQNEEEIIPIEVKSGTNIKSVSFKFFCEKYKPAKAIRTSLADYQQEDWMVNLPLYAINLI